MAVQRVSQCHARGVRQLAGICPGSAGHAAGQLRASRAHFTFHCACGAILIPELNPELNDADPRVDLCCVLQAGEGGRCAAQVPQSSTILIPELNFCRDSLVPVSQLDFGIGNEQKSSDIKCLLDKCVPKPRV